MGLLRSGADAVQCRYLVRNAGASVRTRLMSIALRAFNVLRARGRDGLGLSCGIYGNGFGLRGEPDGCSLCCIFGGRGPGISPVASAFRT